MFSQLLLLDQPLSAEKLLAKKLTEAKKRDIYYYRVFVTLLLTACAICVSFTLLVMACSAFKMRIFYS